MVDEYLIYDGDDEFDKFSQNYTSNDELERDIINALNEGYIDYNYERYIFNYSKNKYDAILIDAFKGLNVPFELTTYEALSNAKALLNDDGIVITNIISAIDGNESDFIK